MLLPSIFGEDLFDGFFRGFPQAEPERRLAGFGASAAGVMRTDIRETEDSFELDIDLPGYNKEDIRAELRNGYLTVKAEKKAESSEGGTYLRRERYYGSCTRSFYVGEELKQQDIKAKFDGGILRISVPKKEPEPKAEVHNFISIEG